LADELTFGHAHVKYFPVLKKHALYQSVWCCPQAQRRY